MDNSWIHDPRLKGMEPKKLELLNQFAERLQAAGGENRMEALLSIHQEARQAGVRFNDSETSLLISILTAGLPPGEQKKLRFLQLLARRL